MKRTTVIIAVLVSIFGALVFMKQPEAPKEMKGSVTVHKTATCGCCANYVGYLRTNGYEVTVVNHISENDMITEKRNLGVPESLDSCHTTVFATKENYFVEGHVPLQAINKLLADKPAIKGIGMPGMPSASPGMPGKKTEPFNISQVTSSGIASGYITL